MTSHIIARYDGPHPDAPKRGVYTIGCNRQIFLQDNIKGDPVWARGTRVDNLPGPAGMCPGCQAYANRLALAAREEALQKTLKAGGQGDSSMDSELGGLEQDAEADGSTLEEDNDPYPDRGGF